MSGSCLENETHDTGFVYVVCVSVAQILASLITSKHKINKDFVVLRA